MDKFKNKYRIPSARLQNWDYRSDGAYFITICTKNREPFFGEILDANVSIMKLNELGKLAEQYWLTIPAHFPYVELGNFVVMPNHIHGILIIDKMDDGFVCGVDPVGFVETLHATSLPKNADRQMSHISPKSGSISTIIRSYKSVVSKHARAIHPNFEWQTRFHDHIIRNADSFETIQNYIFNNPANWSNDKFYQ
ncbi:transposase [uncultured Mucilaginibacter sp.]|uniref:transposase n=1 Tax=uncultured Mucilaginibacter sp. TaxID=797541 RepID=UPI0026230DFE|nr:transposase [uncultured Mucilaginibacter sp.]